MEDENKTQFTEDELIEKKTRLFRLISRNLIGVTVVVIIIFAIGTKQSISEQKRSRLSVGATKVNITPFPGIEMSGYGYRASDSLNTSGSYKSTGINDSLYVSCLLFKNESETIIILEYDLLGILLETTHEIRTLIADKIPVKQENILISCTHSHSAPNIISLNGYPLVDPQWKKILINKTMKAVVEAYHNRQSAMVSAGKGVVDGVAASRKVRLSDGSLYHYIGLSDRKLPKGKTVIEKGVIDPELAVITIKSTDGKIIAVLINYACHPWLYNGNLISSEICGACNDFVEKNLTRKGHHAIAVFTVGAASNVTTAQNQKPVPYDLKQKEVWFESERQRFGAILGSKAMDIIENTADFRDDISLVPELYKIQCPCYKRKLKEILSDRGTLPPPDYLRKTEVQVFKLGDDIVLVGLPSEVYVDIGLMIKKESKFKNTIIISYSNDYFGDFITQQAVDERTCPQLEWTAMSPAASDLLVSVLKEPLSKK